MDRKRLNRFYYMESKRYMVINYKAYTFRITFVSQDCVYFQSFLITVKSLEQH